MEHIIKQKCTKTIQDDSVWAYVATSSFYYYEFVLVPALVLHLLLSKLSNEAQIGQQEKMGTLSSISTKPAISTFIILATSLIVNTVVLSLSHSTNKETLDFFIVGRGGGDRDKTRTQTSKGCHNNEFHGIHISSNCQKSTTSNGSPPPLPNEEIASLVFADQRLALVYPVIQKFKSIITSDPLGITKSWVGSDICKYSGFYCDTPPDNHSATVVASIDFNGFQLSAPTLDGFLDQLPDIALFHANSNYFSGTISSKISKLSYLYELDISNNQFSGSFPMAVLGMDSLTLLDIRFNFFTGSVPPQIFTQNLDALFINNNDFTQTFPDNLGSSHVLFLTLANNKFTGPIPQSIAKALSSVTEVLLLNNELTGCLPYEIGFLNETTVLDASNNTLTGPLPYSLGCLEKLEELNLAGNLFYGMVPEVLCVHENLVNISLSNNFFMIVGPLCRRLIEKGVLDVSNNCILDLPFQRPVYQCARFFSKPRKCPRMWTYPYIPCKLPHFGSDVTSGPQIAPSPN
jgi:hypothetical protein